MASGRWRKSLAVRTVTMGAVPIDVGHRAALGGHGDLALKRRQAEHDSQRIGQRTVELQPKPLILERLCGDLQPVRACWQPFEGERPIGRSRCVLERRAVRRPHGQLGARDGAA